MRRVRVSSSFECLPLESRLYFSTYPLTSMPVLNSNPSARAQLYLDFDGQPAEGWDGYFVPQTPAYTQDADATTFSDSELVSIRDIWARVAEKYSPFNVNVTTVNPGSFSDKLALHVVIGGNGSWSGGTYGGVAYVGSFYNTALNTVYVFPANLGAGNPRYTAEAITHESGHGFGLDHHSSYDASGNKTAEYSTGTSAVAPIMGSSYYATRGLWLKAADSYGPTSIQDDLAILSGSSNGFGYRADAVGNTISTAAALSVAGPNVSTSGIIETMTDRDYFSFTTDAGTVSFTGSIVTGGMLDMKLELWTASGTLLATADTSSLGETLSMSVPAGSYRLVVASHGSYGDVGQYAVSGTIIPAAAGIAAPANLRATVISASQIDLTWTDQSANETGFVVQRSADGGATWINLATVAANVTAYQDASAGAGTYVYRVFAAGSGTNSDFSTSVGATAVPVAPANLIATAGSAQISLSWLDVSGETGYRIERSVDGISGWMTVGTTSQDRTSFQNTGLSANAIYYYRVIAIGLGADSAASNVANATTVLVSTPTAPSAMSAVLFSKNKIRVTWIDNSSDETGFTIQRSTDGRNWSTIATLPANTTSYTNSGMKRGTYYYRVSAYNAAGSSAFSQVTYASLGQPVTGSPNRSTGTFSIWPIKPTGAGSKTILVRRH